MKILHVITGLSNGGAERSLYNLISFNFSPNYKYYVLSLTGEAYYGLKIRKLDVPVYSLDMRYGILTPSSLWRLRSIVKSINPTVIQGWMYHGNLAACIAKSHSFNSSALIWNIRHSLHQLSYERFKTRQVIRINKLLSSKPDAILYNSEVSREQHEKFGFCNTRSKIIPNGINLKEFYPIQARQESFRSALNIPLDAFVIGHIARFHEMKDHIRFLRVTSNLMKKYNDLHVLLAGSDVVSSNNVLIKTLPEDLFQRFHFLGERSDVNDLMRVMNIFCLSSRWGEAFPNVLGEAMATCLPCIATDVGDSARILGDTGIVIPPGDDAALNDGLTRLLNMTSDQRTEIGRKARLRIEANYGLDSIIGQYETLYQKLI